MRNLVPKAQMLRISQLGLRLPTHVSPSGKREHVVELIAPTMDEREISKEVGESRR